MLHEADTKQKHLTLGMSGDFIIPVACRYVEASQWKAMSALSIQFTCLLLVAWVWELWDPVWASCGAAVTLGYSLYRQQASSLRSSLAAIVYTASQSTASLLPAQSHPRIYLPISLSISFLHLEEISILCVCSPLVCLLWGSTVCTSWFCFHSDRDRTFPPQWWILN